MVLIWLLAAVCSGAVLLLRPEPLTTAERDFILATTLTHDDSASDPRRFGHFLLYHGVPANPLSIVPATALKTHLDNLDICYGIGYISELLITASFSKISPTFCHHVTGEKLNDLFLYHLVSLHPAPSFEHRRWFVRKSISLVKDPAQFPTLLHQTSDDQVIPTWNEIIKPFVDYGSFNKQALLVLVALYNRIPMDPNYSQVQTDLQQLWLREWSSEDERSRWTNPGFVWPLILKQRLFQTDAFNISFIPALDSTVWKQGLVASCLCHAPTAPAWSRIAPVLLRHLPLVAEIPCRPLQVMRAYLPVFFTPNESRLSRLSPNFWITVQAQLLLKMMEAFRQAVPMCDSLLRNVLLRLWTSPMINVTPLVTVSDIMGKAEEIMGPARIAVFYEQLMDHFFSGLNITLPDHPQLLPYFLQVLLTRPLLALVGRPQAQAKLLVPWIALGRIFTNLIKSMRVECYQGGLLELLRQRLTNEETFLADLQQGVFDLDLLLQIPVDLIEECLEESSLDFKEAFFGLMGDKIDSQDVTTRLDQLSLQ